MMPICSRSAGWQCVGSGTVAPTPLSPPFWSILIYLDCVGTNAW